MKLTDIVSRKVIDQVVDRFVANQEVEIIAEELGIKLELVTRILSTPAVAKRYMARKKAAIQLLFYGPIATRLALTAAEGAKREAVQSANLLDKMFGLSDEAYRVRTDPKAEEDELDVIEDEEDIEDDREPSTLEDVMEVLKHDDAERQSRKI